ncbi:MAG TPA: hypothetical protein VD902_12775 [Symbiobacteriaceae bacterium]|nr:hypothetical protein [Symbiobacteriaceae bacterium]
MARKPKTPYEVGREVWVKAKVTRVAPYPTMPELIQITVEMPNGNRETMNLNEDKVKPAEG